MWHLKKFNDLKILIKTTQNQISVHVIILAKNWRKLKNAMGEDPFPLKYKQTVVLKWGLAPLPFSLIFSRMKDTWKVQNLKVKNKPRQHHLFHFFLDHTLLSAISHGDPQRRHQLRCCLPLGVAKKTQTH